jgi:amphi-Trp domain-containing protein
MRKDKKMFSHLSLQNAKSIDPILAAISKGLAKGELKFSDDDDDVILSPEGLLRLKVSASKSESVHKVNIKISWHVSEPDLDKKKPLSVTSHK